MFSGFYTAASGMLMNQRSLNMAANNIANVKTSGYKPKRLVKTTFDQQLVREMNGRTEGLGQGSTISVGTREMTTHGQGPIEDTGKTYDLAINGDGFFVIQGENGQYLTRNGHFTRDDEGNLMLPGVDGFEICKKIREKKNTPILMVSAKKDDIDKIRGLGLGADDYITKPFSPSELVARVKAHLARYERLIGSNVQKNDIMEIRGIRIDKTARRVWVNDEEKQFTTKEFDLLTFLAENPNHVFTKDELFSKIWDMESIGDIATVTVHIKKIREKIEFNTAKPQYIETIWGVGYRFKV